jgi:hypothetical protein
VSHDAVKALWEPRKDSDDVERVERESEKGRGEKKKFITLILQVAVVIVMLGIYKSESESRGLAGANVSKDQIFLTHAPGYSTRNRSRLQLQANPLPRRMSLKPLITCSGRVLQHRINDMKDLQGTSPPNLDP